LRELRAKEDSLQAREEKLRLREERLVQQETALQLREQQMQSEVHTHRHTAPLQRQVSASAVDEGDYRRMSLPGGDEDESVAEEVRKPEKSSTATAPFHIFCDGKEEKRAQGTNKDDFTTGVARARELLGRPRLMARANSCQSDITGKQPQDKNAQSAFYKNYLNSRQTENASENIDPSKPLLNSDVTAKVSRCGDTSRSMRQPPAPPPQRRRLHCENTYPPGVPDANCGSATKRPRHESTAFESDVDKSASNLLDTAAVPSVHIDLHSLLTNGKNRLLD
jgi:hypothetical protein